MATEIKHPPVPNTYICKACGSIGQHWIMCCKSFEISTSHESYSISPAELINNQCYTHIHENPSFCFTSRYFMTCISIKNYLFLRKGIIMDFSNDKLKKPKYHFIDDLSSNADRLEWLNHFNALENQHIENKKQIDPFCFHSIQINKDREECIIHFEVKLSSFGSTSSCIFLYDGFNEKLPSLSDRNRFTLLPNDIIGYIGNLLIQYNGGNVYYYDLDAINAEWTVCDGTEHLNCYPDGLIIKLPHSKKLIDIYYDCGLYIGGKMYICNIKTKQFKAIEFKSFALSQGYILRLTNMRFNIRFNNDTYFVHKECLYQLKWKYVDINDDNICLEAIKHLFWMNNWKRMCYGGNEFGLLLFQNTTQTKTDKKFNIIFYNPSKQHIIPIDMESNDVLKEKKFEYGVWFDDRKYLSLFTMNEMFIIHQQFIEQCQQISIMDCYDEKEYNDNCSFNAYIPSNSAGFQKIESNLCETEVVDFPRVPFYYLQKYLSHCYWIIAGFNCNKFVDKELISPKYLQLQNVYDISQYLGCPIWYQYKKDIKLHLIQCKAIGDFKHYLKKSLCCSIFGDNSSGNVSLDELEWFGIIDVRDNGKLTEDNIIKKNIHWSQVTDLPNYLPSVHYPNFDEQYFEIQSGIIAINTKWMLLNKYKFDKSAQIGNCKKGKWHWKLDENKSNSIIIAYHESVEYDKNCTEPLWINNINQIMQKIKNNFDAERNDIDDETELNDLIEEEENYQEILVILQKCLGNQLLDGIIQLISQFCYFSKTLNWIDNNIENIGNNWFIHIYGEKYIQSFQNEICIMDYYKVDNFDECGVENPWKGLIGYKSYLFGSSKWKRNGNLWMAMINQTIKKKIPSSVKYGCILNCSKFKRSVILGNVNQNTKQIVSISIIFIS